MGCGIGCAEVGRLRQTAGGGGGGGGVDAVPVPAAAARSHDGEVSGRQWDHQAAVITAARGGEPPPGTWTAQLRSPPPALEGAGQASPPLLPGRRWRVHRPASAQRPRAGRILLHRAPF